MPRQRRDSKRKGGKRTRHVLNRKRRLEKKGRAKKKARVISSLKSKRPRASPVSPRQKKKLGLARKIATTALIAVTFLGAKGCKSPEVTYSKTRNFIDHRAVKAGSSALNIFPGGKTVGREAASWLLELVLGPNPSAEIAKIEASGRFPLSGRPHFKELWFKKLGLNPRIEADKYKIDLVEMIADSISGKGRVFPEEVVLVIGANSMRSVGELRAKEATLDRLLENIDKQIGIIRDEYEKKFFPKLAKREVLNQELQKRYAEKCRVLIEFFTIKRLLEVYEIDPQSFHELMGLGKNINCVLCRHAIQLFRPRALGAAGK